MRTCQNCGGDLPTRARRDTRTCSPRCRVALHRAESLPVELTSRRRWVRHSAVKVPLTTAGRPASSTDPGTWTTYVEARRSVVGAGMGYVLAAGDGIVCIDLDHVLVDGRPTREVQELLTSLPATYVEVSPSGDGLHVWGRGDLPRGRVVRRDGWSIEAYGTGRYITVTGRRWPGSPSRLADLSEVLSML